MNTLTAEQVMTIAGKHQPDYCSDTHVCFDWQAIADELNSTLGRETCEYCNGAMPIPYQYADGFSGWIEIVIDDATLFVQVGNDELAIPINYCPICGRKVKQ